MKEKKKSWHDYYCKLLDLLKYFQTRQEKKSFHRRKLDQCLAWKICFYNLHCTTLQECLLMAMETDPYSRKLLWGIEYSACSLVPSLPWQARQLSRQVPHPSEREDTFWQFHHTASEVLAPFILFLWWNPHHFFSAALQNPGCDCSQDHSVPPSSLLWKQEPWSKVRTQVTPALKAGGKAVSHSAGAYLLKSQSSHWRTSSLISHTTLPDARTASSKQPVPISFLTNLWAQSCHASWSFFFFFLVGKTPIPSPFMFLYLQQKDIYDLRT